MSYFSFPRSLLTCRLRRACVADYTVRAQIVSGQYGVCGITTERNAFCWYGILIHGSWWGSLFGCSWA
jgi:hypothetical protein